MDCTYTLDALPLEECGADALPSEECGTYTLDAVPSEECGGVYVLLGMAGFLIWGVAVPLKLYRTLKKDASDGAWTADEIEAHAWVLLKYKPNRWWFVSNTCHCAPSWLARIN